ncbi:WD40 repeat-like protein [Trametes sanguinea]|nr:WD40 repeat-like protein [Trametes sanguinea]
MSTHQSFLRRTLGSRGRRGASGSDASAHSHAPANEPQMQDVSVQESHRQRKRKVVNTIVSRLIPALEVTKELSASQPPLQLAIGALIVVLEAYEKCCANAEAMEALEGQIERLNTMLKNVLPAGQERCPQALKRRLERFAKDLQSVSDNAKHIQSQRLIVRMAKASEIEGQIEECVKTVSWLIQCFIVEGSIAVELAVHEIAEDTRQGFVNMSGRFDRVDEELDGIRQDISQWGTNAIPGLRYAPNARWDYARSGRSECDPETRREVLASIWSWLLPGDPTRLKALPDPLFTVPPECSMLWVKAMAGAGKSTVAQTIVEWSAEAKILGAGFFCGRDGARSDALRIVQNIASELAAHSPDFYDALCAATKANPHIQTAHVSQQLKTLVVEPLGVANARRSFPRNLVVVIDGLDECNDDNAISVILQALSLHSAGLAPLKFIILSRPVENITRGYRALEELRKKTFEFALDSIPADIARRDIALFLRNRLEGIKSRRIEAGFTCSSDWPSKTDFDSLISLTGSLFIFAATAIRFIEDPEVSDPESQLVLLLASVKRGLVPRTSTSPFWQLDVLYLQALRKAFPSLSASLRSLVKLLLGTIALAEEQLSPLGLEVLLGLRPGTARGTLNKLQSIFYVPSVEEEPKPTRFLHLSFPDFIVDPSRCESSDFLVHPSLQHTVIAQRCLEVMKGLKQNICEVDWSNDHLLNVEIAGLTDKIARCLSPAVAYGCKYWSRHLCSGELGEDLLRALEDFCDHHLLHWLEALSLLGCVEVAMDALQSAQLYLKQHSTPLTRIPALLYDCECMVRTFHAPIKASFFQVYKSALVLSPTDSPLRRRYTEEIPRAVRVRMGAEKAWNLTGSIAPHGTTNALDFSPDGKFLLTGLIINGSIQMWDTYMATQVQFFQGNRSTVHSVSFSPSGKEILAGSHDGTVSVWDVISGASLGSWQRHSAEAKSVAWSVDGTLIASGAADGTVALCSMASPELTTVLNHGDKVWDVVFACDGSLLSASQDGTCKIWNTQSRSITRVLEHSSPVLTLAVSPDNRLVACGLENGEITLWRTTDWQRLRSLPAIIPRFVPGISSGFPLICATFLSATCLASASSIFACTLWDVARADVLNVLAGETNRAVAFSPNGALIARTPGPSAVTIEQWPAVSPEELKVLRSLVMPTSAPGKLENWRLFAQKSAGTLLRLRPWAEATEAPSGVLRQHVQDAVLSPDGQRIVAIDQQSIHLLDASSGDCVRTIRYESNVRRVVSVTRTADVFLTAEDDYMLYVWNANMGHVVRRLAGHSDTISAVLFTHDEQQVVSASWDGTIRRWGLHLNRHQGQGEETSELCNSEVLFRTDGQFWVLAVSYDGEWMLSASQDRSLPDTSSADLVAKPSRRPYQFNGTYPTLRLHDRTGRVVWIEHYPVSFTALAFSDDGMRALAGSVRNDIVFYDFSQLLRLDQAAPPPAVQERLLTSTSKLIPRQISFSPDHRGVITDRGYTPLPPELVQPLSQRGEHSAPPAARFIDDQGWLWRVAPYSTPRRLCWLPFTFRPAHTPWLNTWSVRGDVIVCKTGDNRLLMLDTSHS